MTTPLVHRDRTAAVLAGLLVLLAGGITAATIAGPLVLDRLVYRTSDTTLHQVVGGDLAGLVVVVPVALVAATLVWRGHPLAPVLALGPGLWAVYVYLQLIVGQEHLDLPGNSERFFPLLLGVFVLGGAVAVLAWSLSAVADPSPPGRRLERTTGIVLLVLASFLVVGLHLPTLLDAMGDDPTSLEYTSSPTAFWIVKVMDLGIIVPAAIATGVGLLLGAAGARRPARALLVAYALLSASVTGMAVVMLVHDDPDGSIVDVVAFGTFTLVVGALAWRMVRPGPDERPATSDHPTADRTTVPVTLEGRR
jgi:hypothetical protein